MNFAEYVANGWVLCAIPHGSKGPRTKGWQRRENGITTAAEAVAAPGVGLCHRWSGTCAIDFDDLDRATEWLDARGISVRELFTAPTAVRISSGRPNRGKLLYALPSPLASLKLAPYKDGEKTFHALELRCASVEGLTLQDVLPGSLHPGTGMPYVFEYGDDLVADWKNLPQIPAPLLALWQQELASTRTTAGPVASSGTSSQELEALLAQFSPDLPYDEWVRVGAALHHESQGSPLGFEIFDRWSSRGSKYVGRADCAAKWNSFRLDAKNAVTLGSLRRETVAQIADFPVAETAPAPEPAAVEAQGWDAVKTILEPRLIFVRGQDHYFDLASHGEPWVSDRSLRHMFCPLMPQIEVEVEGKGGKQVKKIKPDPVMYMQNSRSKRVVDAVGLNPGAARLYKEDGREFVNRYYPKKIEPLLPLPHEKEAFLFLWSRIADPLMQRWLMQFYAHALQKPGVKIQTAPLLVSSETGTGKNTLCHVIPQLLFGEKWVRTISGDVLKSQFNDTIGETWWLYLEELRAGSHKAERIALTNKIKSWVTDNILEVHPKGMKPYNTRNRIQITGTSNFEDALHLDNNDRRWAISGMGPPLTERESTDVYHFLNSERAPGVLRHIFGNTNITGFNPTARAPATTAKTAMIRASVGSWESMIVEMMVSGAAPFGKDVFRLQDASDTISGKGGPPTLMALRGVLSKAPFNCKQLPNGREHRWYAWRNVDIWSKVSDAARLRYLETGHRPSGYDWDDSIPAAVVAMSADGPEEAPAKVPCDLV